MTALIGLGGKREEERGIVYARTFPRKGHRNRESADLRKKGLRARLVGEGKKIRPFCLPKKRDHTVVL